MKTCDAARENELRARKGSREPQVRPVMLSGNDGRGPGRERGVEVGSNREEKKVSPGDMFSGRFRARRTTYQNLARTKFAVGLVKFRTWHTESPRGVRRVAEARRRRRGKSAASRATLPSTGFSHYRGRVYSYLGCEPPGVT